MKALGWLLPLLLCTPAATTWAAPVYLGLTTKTDPAAVAAAATRGVKLVRIRADWQELQPDAKTWSFGKLDAAVREAVARELKVVLVLGPTPAWSVSYLTDPTPEQVRRAMPDLAAYATYAATVAKRYGAKVPYFQLWERPTPANLLASAEYVQAMYRTGARALHGLNPAPQVIAAVPGGVNLGWITDYLQKAEGTAWPDVLLLTPATIALTPDTYHWRVQPLRELVLPPTGAPALWADLPLGGAKPRAKATIAAALMQDLSMILFHPAEEGIDLTSDEDTAKTLRLLARVQGTEYMGYASPVPGVDIALFRTPAALTGLLAPAGPLAIPLKPSTVPLAAAVAVPGEAVELLQLEGEARRVPVLTETTVEVDGPLALISGITLNTVARARFDTPPVLAGDTLVFDPTGKDLCTICPLPGLPGGRFTVTEKGEETVIATVRGEQPWIYLEVPDGFLFYNRDSLPVEITVRVYGVRQAQKSGFSIYYDAFGGMKHSPWQEIGGGEDVVYSYTIRLDDALLADREGYDLRLEMGGSKENLRLLGVTLKKLPK